MASRFPRRNPFSPANRCSNKTPIPTTNVPCVFTHNKNTTGSVHNGQLTSRRNHSSAINTHSKNRYANIWGRKLNDNSTKDHISAGGTNPAFELPERRAP